MRSMRFKQKTLHIASSNWSKTDFWALLCIFCIEWATATGLIVSTGSAIAQGLASPHGNQVAQVRLLLAPGLANGRYRAGIEIIMPPGSHTYWKQPGEAGVPPVFAFNGSDNVAKADVLFPVPSRIEEDGISIFGYRDQVVFPVLVTPAKPSDPARLDVDVNYAVCNKICVPEHATASLALSGPSRDGSLVLTALAKVPHAATAAELKALAINFEPNAPKPTWTLVWSGPSPVEDLFADAPEGFFFETRKIGPNRFLLVAEQMLPEPKQVPVVLTVTSGTSAFVLSQTLDLAHGTP